MAMRVGTGPGVMCHLLLVMVEAQELGSAVQ